MPTAPRRRLCSIIDAVRMRMRAAGSEACTCIMQGLQRWMEASQAHARERTRARAKEADWKVSRQRGVVCLQPFDCHLQPAGQQANVKNLGPVIGLLRGQQVHQQSGNACGRARGRGRRMQGASARERVRVSECQ